MALSPNAKIEYYTEGQDEGHVNINEAYQRLENGPPLRVEEIGTTDPASLAYVDGVDDGKCVIVGVGAPSTAFFGHDDELAMFYAGWIFRPIRPDELVFRVDTGLFEWFDSAFSAWRPVNAPIDTTSRDSGRVGVSAAPIQHKTLHVAGLPNNGTSAGIPHGISGFPVTLANYARIVALATDGTTVRPIPYYDGTNRITYTVDGTNVVITTNFNASAWDARFVFEFE